MSNKVGGISNIRATDGGNIASFRSNDSKIGQYIDVNSERAVINYMENGEWKTGFVLASKSDLFENGWVVDPNTCTSSFSLINGWGTVLSNVPNDAKNTLSSLQTFWENHANIGDLTKTRLQILITGNNTMHTRRYINDKWSAWS